MPDAPDLADVRAYYRKILFFYEKESSARSRLAFWEDLARRSKPRRILEIGSGPGWIAAALSRRAPTVGIDISFELLGRASRRFRGAAGLGFVAADMREPVFGGRFDLIVAPSDPFCHLTRARDRRRALRRVAGWLSPGGRFVLEGLHRRPGFDYPERRIPYRGGVLRVGERWTPLDRRRGLWRAEYVYRDRPAGGEEKTLEASFVARAWEPAEARRLFASCGLEIEEMWGDFDRRFFRGAAARKLVLVARPRARFMHPVSGAEKETSR